MGYKLIVKPGAELDITEALDWYAENTELSPELFTEIEEVLTRIETDPDNFQKRYKEIRIVFTDRFHYGVHYTVENTTVYVHAVLHTSRKPKG
ncbi:type II toxin-antitoxin system RelE/ParE family toxin [Aquimarina aggregata]|uniref:type II toxin-antitoxin system RelE/ParE family toxin n=1 Tax=Aquimarina aggregata TaxID=1642818 RepID=UPI002490DBED|nr:type II toxin-antitoxin system RelE/ParE family toxin [Aquimarina aggregata]